MRRSLVNLAVPAAAAGSLFAAGASHPLFYRDVLPILQARCQACHRPGEIAPMPFTTYRQTRPWARAIRAAVLTRKMPPWFADPSYGRFANDPSLSRREMETLADWADSGAGAGDPTEAPPGRAWPEGWNIQTPGAVLETSRSVSVPASGALEYQYIALPTGFTADRWVRQVEIRPRHRSVVHHAVVYVREPGSPWLKDAPSGTPFVLPSAPGHIPNPASLTTSDILMVYTPGHGFDSFPPGMAKKIPAGADLILQIHYTPNGKAAEDRTRIGLVFSSAPPAKSILTLQMGNDRFAIPPGDPDYRVQVSGTLPNDALLVGFFPHMHLRGKGFEYALAAPGGRLETLLKVDHFDFHWQLSYRLAEPRPLAAGARLIWTARFDNSPNNPRNPDPAAEVRFGEQSWEEMMIGFFDVAVDPAVDKRKFFERAP